MKISELIAQLQETQEKWGDLKVSLETSTSLTGLEGLMVYDNTEKPSRFLTLEDTESFLDGLENPELYCHYLSSGEWVTG